MATEQLTQMLLQGTWDTLYVTVVSTLLAYIIGIPLAAGVWIPIFGWTLQPMFGALAMSLSSFCVVTNALRLNLFRLHEAKHDKHRQPAALPEEFTAAPQETNNTARQREEKTMYKTTVTVEGMMCHMCEKHVNEAVSNAFAAENPVSDHTANKTAFISAGSSSGSLFSLSIIPPLRER